MAAAASRTTVTARGIGLSTAGVAVGALGVGLASPPLVYIGIAALVAAVVGRLWLTLAIHTFLLRFPFAHRHVVPRPLTVGQPARVTVTISSASRGKAGSAMRRALAESLDIREQAAAELTGGLGTKATVTRSAEALSLHYTLHPSARGRWPLGPALVHSADPLGMAWADTEVGRPERVPVWPTVVDLSGTAGALMGVADRVVLGARTPSPDDASLRDYRDGDDLRRVHWPSSARTGTMMVRSDERAGRRPATVLLDPPRDRVAIEWSISLAASVAISVLESGHPVRLLGGTIDVTHAAHLGKQHVDAARADLLNLTVDLAGAADAQQSTTELLRAAHAAAEDLAHGEVIVGVFDALEQRAIDALSPLGAAGRAWAIVRRAAADEGEAERTAQALRRTGWRAMAVEASDDLAGVWTALLRAGDMA